MKMMRFSLNYWLQDQQLRSEIECWRNRTFEPSVLGFKQNSHAAFAELGEDFVMGDGFADHKHSEFTRYSAA